MVLDTQVQDFRALISKHGRSETTGQTFDWDTGRHGGGNTKLDGGQDGLERRLSTFALTAGSFDPVIVAAATSAGGASWTESTQTLAATAGFATYSFVAGDVVHVAYPWLPTEADLEQTFHAIDSRTDANEIVTVADINAAAGDIASGIVLTIYRPTHQAVTYTATGNILTKTASFTNYHWSHLDRVLVVSGTGATLGAYYVLSKTSDDAITIGAAITGSAADVLGSGDIADVAIVLYKQTSKPDVYVPEGAFQDGGKLTFHLSGQWNNVGNVAGGTNLVFTGATYTEDVSAATPPTLVKVAAFADYEFAVGDYVYITGGTNARAGLYPISARVDDDTILLGGSLNQAASAQTNIAFKIIKAVSISFKLWTAYPDGSSPAVLIAGSAGTNDNAWVLPYVPTAAGLGNSACTFDIEMSLVPTAGHESGPANNIVCRGVFQFDISNTGLATAPYAACYRTTVDLKGPRIYYMSFKKTAGSSFIAGLNPKHLSVYHSAPSSRSF